MGDEGYERQPTDDELAKMADVVREAIAAGAAGFASSSAPTHSGDGGRPVPSRLADDHELEALTMPMRELGRGVGAFTLGGDTMQLYKLQRKIGRPFTWTALLTIKGSSFASDMRELNTAQRAEGVDVWPQVTPRPLTFQMTLEEPFTFNTVPSFNALMKGSREERLAAYADPAWRRKAQEELETGGVFRAKWDTVWVAQSRKFPELEQRSMEDLAKERGKEPLDVLLEIACDEDLETRFGTVLSNNDPEMIEVLLQTDGMLLGLSDAGAHVSQLCDACMPTDLLGNWVREKEVLTLEEAIRKLTSEPATIYGFADRGVLAPGKAADVTVLDPDTVAPGPVRRIRDFPADGERLVADQPGGIRHVIVNGTPIRVDDEPVAEALEARPGRILRG
jgi:N-acyl-D-aspartate/D-glutamate deacylase